jgi:Cu+-exporting ATPase
MALETLTIAIGGMSCANCARSVERKLGSTPGVTKVAVDLERGVACVEYDTGLVTPSAIASEIRTLGYEATA